MNNWRLVIAIIDECLVGSWWGVPLTLCLSTGSFTRTFGTSTLSEEELKKLTNVEKKDEIYAEVGGVTVLEKYTW